MLTLLLTGILTSPFNIQPVKSIPATIVVPDDYPTIQNAINAASEGGMIVVSQGQYKEGQINVNKTVALVANGTVIVDGLQKGSVFYVTRNDVTIRGFTILNSSQRGLQAGICLSSVRNGKIYSNIIESNMDGVELLSCFNITVTCNSIRSNVRGIFALWGLGYECNSTISGNAIINNTYDGMYLVESGGNVISNNTIAGNEPGIFDNNGRRNMFFDNHIDSNSRAGIICTASGSTISCNVIVNNGRGIWIYNAGGILVSNNTITGNQAGVSIELSARDNLISGNTIANNMVGVSLSLYLPNSIFHNNFIDNIVQASAAAPQHGEPARWDDGYPSGGNYWSDYTGIDADSDGIGDTPYTIDSNNIDHYPLMKPWMPVAEKDLYFKSLEVIQVVHDASALVAGKSTVAMIELGKKGYVGDLEVRIKLTIDGNICFNDYVKVTDEKFPILSSFKIENEGTHEIKVEIDPENEIAESDESNNIKVINAVVKDTKGLRIVYVPVDWESSDLESYYKTVEYGGKFLVATYPIAEDKYVQKVSSTSYSTKPWPRIIDALLHLSALRKRLDPKSDCVVGIVPKGWFEEHFPIFDGHGIGLPGLNVALVEEGFYSSIAHEVTHIWLGGGHHERMESGYWVNAFFAEKPGYSVPETLCFMYHEPFISGEVPPKFPDPSTFYGIYNRWICKETYEALLLKFKKSITDPEILFLSGLISKNGTVELSPWYLLPEGSVDYVLAGNYSIQVLDYLGQVLYETTFYVPFELNQQEIEVSGFAFAVPYVTTASTVLLRHENQTLTKIDLNIKLLYDAVDLIPDYGFVNNPAEQRKALHNKIDALAKMLEERNFKGAVQKLEFDITDKLDKWLIGGYVTANALQMTKDEVINLANMVIRALKQFL